MTIFTRMINLNHCAICVIKILERILFFNTRICLNKVKRVYGIYFILEYLFFKYDTALILHLPNRISHFVRFSKRIYFLLNL